MFRKSQLSLIEKLGMIKYATGIVDSDKFAVRSNLKVKTAWFRRSILMNLITSSYTFGRCLNARSLFGFAIKQSMQLNKQVKVLRLVEDKNGGT